MSRFLQITLLFVFFISIAMQCDNETLKIAQEMDLQVNPNPIPIKNGEAFFELITALPAVKTLKKIDSLVLELSYQQGERRLIIGTTKMTIPTNWKATTNLYDTAIFELTNLLVSDDTTLYFQMNMHKNRKTKTTVPLAVSYFENDKDER